MTQRPPHEDETQFALWNHKRTADTIDAYSVMVAHADIGVGESIALLLRLKGLTAVCAADVDALQLMLEHWKPRALLFDTRLGQDDDFRLIRAAAKDPAFANVLIIAMTNIWPDDSPAKIRSYGFDGLCRRPCPVWKLADVLN
ncbi:response regulator receiver protein [Paraburkholderia sp. DGU8]|jgi:CheY-like chemotaxis protein|uniref:response regulator receiver protein n=1 Tax=Paraburkholderia sp. DGU8 TaxID=3161997 RepID=UPI003465C805